MHILERFFVFIGTVGTTTILKAGVTGYRADADRAGRANGLSLRCSYDIVFCHKSKIFSQKYFFLFVSQQLSKINQQFFFFLLVQKDPK